MIIVDTTVLVYAVGAEHPLAEPCRRLVESIGAGRVSAATTTEVIQEFAHVRARRRTRREAVRDARAFAELLAPLMSVDEDTLRDGLRIFQQTQALGAFDAVLAAAAMARDATALVSADAAFSGVAGLRHLQPDSPELLEVAG